MLPDVTPVQVPIIPAFLYELHHTHDMMVLNQTYATSTLSPVQLWNQRVDREKADSSRLLAAQVAASINPYRKTPFPTMSSKCEKEVRLGLCLWTNVT